jgi:cation-transporting P-type ATPase 13A2
LELELIRIFEFESSKRRMSVIVQKSETKYLQVYVKGAPEIMPDICQPTSCTTLLPLSDKVPSDYEEMLDFYTHHGYRVIALAAKSLPNISLKRAGRMKRAEAESDLTFLGFIVFENKLKPSTPGVLSQLRDAKIRTVMCTGDNILTAISVARECELVSHDGYVFVPHFREGCILANPLI